MPAHKSAARESIRYSHYRIETEYTHLFAVTFLMQHTQIFILSLPHACVFLTPREQ